MRQPAPFSGAGPVISGAAVREFRKKAYLCAMNMRLFISAAMLLAVACGNRTSGLQTARPAEVPVKHYTYRVVNTYPHDAESYTQGLYYVDGQMWEGTGQEGLSRLQHYDLGETEPCVVARLPRCEFGEGIALLDGVIYQLTWHTNTVHLYDAATGRLKESLHYPGEGWGLTTDGEALYMSNGSEYIYRVDPKGFKRQGKVAVTFNGQPVDYLNELEWIDGKIWANVYLTDQIVIIDPASGRVEGLVDLEGLLSDADRTEETDVLNGIAWDAAERRLFVTGKNWPKIFEIEIVEQ